MGGETLGPDMSGIEMNSEKSETMDSKKLAERITEATKVDPMTCFQDFQMRREYMNGGNMPIFDSKTPDFKVLFGVLDQVLQAERNEKALQENRERNAAGLAQHEGAADYNQQKQNFDRANKLAEERYSPGEIFMHYYPESQAFQCKIDVTNSTLLKGDLPRIGGTVLMLRSDLRKIYNVIGRNEESGQDRSMPDQNGNISVTTTEYQTRIPGLTIQERRDASSNEVQKPLKAISFRMKNAK